MTTSQPRTRAPVTPLNLELTCCMGNPQASATIVEPAWPPAVRPVWQVLNVSIQPGESSVAQIIFYHHILAWPISSLGFFCTILQENLNKLSGQPRGPAPDVQLAPRKWQLLLLSHLSLVLLVGAKITQTSEMGFCVSFDRGLCQNPL